MRGSLQKILKSLSGGWDEAPDCPEKYPRGAENWENSPHSCSSLNQHCLPVLTPRANYKSFGETRGSLVSSSSQLFSLGGAGLNALGIPQCSLSHSPP